MSILRKKNNSLVDYDILNDKVYTKSKPEPELEYGNSIKSALDRMDKMIKNSHYADFKCIKTELETVYDLDNTSLDLFKIRRFYNVLAYKGKPYEIELIEYAYDSKYAKEFYE